MASKFQSRLVGTIILVAIGIIFLPDLFDGQKAHYQEEFASIPLQPEYEAVYVEQDVLPPDVMPVEPEPVMEQFEIVDAQPAKPVSSSGEEDLVIDDVQALPIETLATVEVAPEKPQLADTSWAVQLGVFRNYNNASSLVEQLKGAGYQAHVLPKQPVEGELARVLVGPDLSKQKLEGQLDALQEITGLRGRLVRFNPLNP
ncbi:SPOR domain-containing protein [Thaumasiovibrio subtropicus]|uniref:SPOR domain-containing protein n=1 Tax=Thaumasiovibrio subtropicus TaxID=1891207 RepID=UPI000B35BDF3|nr:SPOR domain-containing protein [Thaumasiovibrio subtropicus]